MDDSDLATAPRRPASPTRPLLGLTVLVVEDSRYACDAIRLLCLHSGARIRRADSLQAARRHIQTYRPSVLIVDIGLPDGSGADLIREAAQMSPRINTILGWSGDDLMRDVALAAGADGFFDKPCTSLTDFQGLILSHLPAERRPIGPRPLMTTHITPDTLALRDDMAHVADLLRGPTDAAICDYAAQFLQGVARSARRYMPDHTVGSEDTRTNAVRSLSRSTCWPEASKLLGESQTRNASFRAGQS